MLVILPLVNHGPWELQADSGTVGAAWQSDRRGFLVREFGGIGHDP